MRKLILFFALPLFFLSCNEKNDGIEVTDQYSIKGNSFKYSITDEKNKETILAQYVFDHEDNKYKKVRPINQIQGSEVLEEGNYSLRYPKIFFIKEGGNISENSIYEGAFSSNNDTIFIDDIKYIRVSN